MIPNPAFRGPGRDEGLLCFNRTYYGSHAEYSHGIDKSLSLSLNVEVTALTSSYQLLPESKVRLQPLSDKLVIFGNLPQNSICTHCKAEVLPVR